MKIIKQIFYLKKEKINVVIHAKINTNKTKKIHIMFGTIPENNGRKRISIYEHIRIACHPYLP